MIGFGLIAYLKALFIYLNSLAASPSIELFLTFARASLILLSTCGTSTLKSSGESFQILLIGSLFSISRPLVVTFEIMWDSERHSASAHSKPLSRDRNLFLISGSLIVLVPIFGRDSTMISITKGVVNRSDRPDITSENLIGYQITSKSDFFEKNLWNGSEVWYTVSLIFKKLSINCCLRLIFLYSSFSFSKNLYLGSMMVLHMVSKI
jgi:hypothetical protein